MTKIDTIQFSTSLDYLRDIDYNHFKTNKISKPNGLEIINHSLMSKKIGVDSISINETLNIIKVKASSKLLGSNYKKGICLSTIEQFTSEINKMGIILDQDYINDCSLKQVDIKNDLSLTKEISCYTNSMNHLIAPKFHKTLYKTGISFNEMIKATPTRLTSYDKWTELSLPKNKAFLKLHPILANHFKDILRIESRLSKKATILKYFKSYSLIDILNHKNLNHTIFKKIVDNQINYEPTYNTLEMTNTEEKNFAQIYLLNQQYNGDFNLILNHIKGKLGKTTKATYQRGAIKKYLAIIKNSNNNETLENITEILNALKQ